MDRTVSRKISQVRIRWSLDCLLYLLAGVLLGTGGLLLISLLIERLLAVPLWTPIFLLSLSGIALVALLILWIRQWPSRLQVCLSIDERMQLRERFSTLYTLESSSDPFAQAACYEAVTKLRNIQPSSHFPIRPTQTWWIVGGLWLVLGGIHQFLPNYDLLGVQEKRDTQTAQQRQWETTTTEIKKETAQVRQIAEQLSHTDLADSLADLQQITKASTPALAREQTMRKLGDLADRIKEMQDDPARQSLNLMQKSLKQLRPGTGEMTQQLQLALARGQFGKAAQIMRSLEKQLREGKLPPAKQQELAQQLTQLSQQLSELARDRSEMEETLEKMGLSKKLAQLSPQQLKAALKKQGLSAEQMEKLLDKQSASQMAQNQASALSQALAGACGGGQVSADELAAATDTLDELAQMKQKFQLSDEALAAIDKACACLGQGQGSCMGGKGPFRPGQSLYSSRGSGGPGMGFGEVDSDSTGNTATQKTRVENTGQGGPAIASWYFQGPQQKGQAQRSWQEVLNASREQAAEAVEENRIPGKYHESVKQYFGQLEATDAED